jgi:hypothetical protein
MKCWKIPLRMYSETGCQKNWFVSIRIFTKLFIFLTLWEKYWGIANIQISKTNILNIYIATISSWEISLIHKNRMNILNKHFLDLEYSWSLFVITLSCSAGRWGVEFQFVDKKSCWSPSARTSTLKTQNISTI